MEIYKEVALRIQWILRSKGMTQSDLAKLLGKNDSEISVWLAGSHNFTISTIRKVENALGRNIIKVVGSRNEES
ncbi:MAG: helix-turn-helix transcriptional regulator [Bacteroidetes bacterium]|uniref:Helix-turn-helix transcriptional regulator n=1 Tax=Candidatus Merdivivens pullicola TaxID=2840872 RepID=A0A9D9IK17_9BACT|nr:helix-turn-helix transcriptional regulator [Candidatus Merdivivens pullicola]